MKLFDNPKPINDRFSFYTFSLFDSNSKQQAMLVNKNWYHFLQIIDKNKKLLPYFFRIPLFKDVALDVFSATLLTGGMTNKTYKVVLAENRKWVVRVAGKGSEKFINRAEEAYNVKIASELGVIIPIKYFDPEDGLQLTPFFENLIPPDDKLSQDDRVLTLVAKQMHTLHFSKKRFQSDIHIFARNELHLNKLMEQGFKFPNGFAEIRKKMDKLESVYKGYGIELCPCHNDLTPLNIALYKDDGKLNVLMMDGEYFNNNDRFFDIGIYTEDFDPEKIRFLLNEYFKEKMEIYGEMILAWYEVFKPIISWWFAIWYWDQEHSKADAVDISQYVTSGKNSFEKTKMLLDSSSFQNAQDLLEEEVRNKEGLVPRLC